MLNVWGMKKKVEEMFGGMKNNLYLCIVNEAPYNPPMGDAYG